MDLASQSPGRKERSKYLPFGRGWHKPCFHCELTPCLAGKALWKGRVHWSSSWEVRLCLQKPSQSSHVWGCAAAHRRVGRFALWKCMCTPTRFLQLHIYWYVFLWSVILLWFVYLQAVFVSSNLLRKTEDGEDPAGPARLKEGETCSQKDLNILSWQTESVLQPVSLFRKWILTVRIQKYG